MIGTSHSETAATDLMPLKMIGVVMTTSATAVIHGSTWKVLSIVAAIVLAWVAS